MNELVFKSDVINLVHKYFGDEINKLPWKEDGDDLYISGKLVAPLLNHNGALSNAIKELPPVDAIENGIREPMADLIERQAAIDALMAILDKPNHAEFLYTDEIERRFARHTL